MRRERHLATAAMTRQYKLHQNVRDGKNNVVASFSIERIYIRKHKGYKPVGELNC